MILSWKLEGAVSLIQYRQESMLHNIDSNMTLNPVTQVDITGMCGYFLNIPSNTAMLPPENAAHRDSIGGKWWVPTLLLQYQNCFFVRNLTEKVEARQWTNTSYQCQCLQDTFASTQRGEINGTALEWKFMVLQVNQLKVRKFSSCSHY